MEEQEKKKKNKNKKLDKPQGKVEMEPVDASLVNNVENEYNKLYSKEDLEKESSELSNSKKILDQEMENLEKDKEIMNEKKQNINDIDSELKKAEELYQQLSSQ